MLLTSEQHRAIAAFLWRKAASEPEQKRLRMLKPAQSHSALARARDARPDLAPKTVRTIEAAYKIAGEGGER